MDCYYNENNNSNQIVVIIRVIKILFQKKRNAFHETKKKMIEQANVRIEKPTSLAYKPSEMPEGRQKYFGETKTVSFLTL